MRLLPEGVEGAPSANSPVGTSMIRNGSDLGPDLLGLSDDERTLDWSPFRPDPFGVPVWTSMDIKNITTVSESAQGPRTACRYCRTERTVSIRLHLFCIAHLKGINVPQYASVQRWRYV